MIDFDRSFASSPRAKRWSDINKKAPCEVYKSSNKKFWFICGECEHSFETRLDSVTNKNAWCPYCANQKLCESKIARIEDCTQCHEKSFASSPRAEFWDHIKNVISKTPRKVFKSCGEKFWFICGDCGHSFETSLNGTTKGGWCPYCANKQLCEVMNCTQCHEKSFVSSPRSEFWDYNKNVISKIPCKVFKNSHTKFWFNCGECKHSFESSLDSVTRGRWCPFCANKKLCKEEDCAQCHEKSFTGSPKAEFWDYNKNIKKKPREVFKSSEEKIWFNCSDKHSFKSRLVDVTAGKWCHMCKNKTEKMFLKWFKTKYKHYVIKHQAKFEWCKDKRHLPFDFSIESLKLIIEIDGPQHFRQVSNWQAPEITQVRDKYKMQKALENGYTVIRISQEDIFKNVVGWEKELVEFLTTNVIFK